jgi:dihydrofolate reductase
MIISLIVAMDEGRGIGLHGILPWHLSADLQHFKALTMGHHLIIGRKTYEAIGRPLPGRKMIVATRSSQFQIKGCLVANSLEQALNWARESGESEAFVGGGAQIFAQVLPLANCMHLTQVHARLECDAFFPPFEEKDWIEKACLFHPQDEKNTHSFTYRLLERNIL